MGLKISNNATSTLAADILATDTSIAVAGGDGAKFPTLAAGDWFPATLVDSSANREIVKVTARDTDTFTVTRGQENTVARTFSAGDRIDLRMTAAAFAVFAQSALNLTDLTDASAAPPANVVTPFSANGDTSKNTLQVFRERRVFDVSNNQIGNVILCPTINLTLSAIAVETVTVGGVTLTVAQLVAFIQAYTDQKATALETAATAAANAATAATAATAKTA